MAAKKDLPDLKPIGPVWREVRQELGARQVDIGSLYGWGPSAQSSMSNRERDPEEYARAVEPTPRELVVFEDAYNLQRGTVLRRAGYVVDAESPLDQIEGWTFLHPEARALIRQMVEAKWIEAGRPGAGRKLRPLPARIPR